MGVWVFSGSCLLATESPNMRSALCCRTESISGLPVWAACVRLSCPGRESHWPGRRLPAASSPQEALAGEATHCHGNPELHSQTIDRASAASAPRGGWEPSALLRHQNRKQTLHVSRSRGASLCGSDYTRKTGTETVPKTLPLTK